MMRHEVLLRGDGRPIPPAEPHRRPSVAEGDRVVILADGERIGPTTARRPRARAWERVRRLFPDARNAVDELPAEH